MPAPPNILILMADQLTPGVLPAYGGKVARTPHLDALARAGVVFESLLLQQPAVRAVALFVARRAVAVAASAPTTTPQSLPRRYPTFAHYLRRAGYQTVLSGKMHFCGPDQLHGFEERLTTDIYPADFGWTPDWTRFEERPGWYHTMDSVTAGRPLHAHQSDRLRRRGRGTPRARSCSTSRAAGTGGRSAWSCR